MNSTDLKKILIGHQPLLDVRAPVEYLAGHIPGAVNIPILNNEERALVGTEYKKKGQESAIQLGVKLISGSIKEERIAAWKDFFKKNPESLIYCFRGGLRSRTAQNWLAEVGVVIPRLEGGYKAARQMLLETIEKAVTQFSILIISGPTGGGKSHLLRAAQNFFPTLDLEKLAQHRGSAFGFEAEPQPRQVHFENLIAQDFLRLLQNGDVIQKPLLIEDESRLIGKNVIPEGLFAKMRSSPIVWVDESLKKRVDNIFEDYISNTVIALGSEEQGLALYLRYEKSLQSIERRLGGGRTQEIMLDLILAKNHYLKKRDLEPNRTWIEKLLVYYYDPLYLSSLEKRNPVVKFRGSAEEILLFLRSL